MASRAWPALDRRLDGDSPGQTFVATDGQEYTDLDAVENALGMN